jgi:hypothetical protein
MAKECYAPCGQRLFGLSPLEASAVVRRLGVIQRVPPVLIQQKLEEVQVDGLVLKQDFSPDMGEITIGYLESLGFKVIEGNVDCPSFCGPSSSCEKAVL